MASNLISIKGKHKVCWKPLYVSAYGLIEHPRLDAIQLRQIPVQHHLLATDEIDFAANPLDWDQLFHFSLFENIEYKQNNRYLLTSC
jgi:hypothetical protein